MFRMIKEAPFLILIGFMILCLSGVPIYYAYIENKIKGLCLDAGYMEYKVADGKGYCIALENGTTVVRKIYPVTKYEGE